MVIMKKKVHFFKRLGYFIQNIPTTDKFLLLFLFVLLLQSCLYLFCYDKLPPNDEATDAMIRSSAATIFGYFISTSFCSHTKNDDMQNTSAVTTKNIHSQNQDTTSSKKIGFLTENTDPALPPQAEQTNTTEKSNCLHQQVVIVAICGFSALVIICVFRNFFMIESHIIPILSQLQDFVVASIGFLVGYTKHHVK